ncbi:MAG TPA: hypothetical protein VF748_07570 [Candidatus Acidoferrum sp.]
MPAVRSSNGEPVVLRCPAALAYRLEMIPALDASRQALEGHQLVFVVACDRPSPLFPKTFLWPAQPGLEAA